MKNEIVLKKVLNYDNCFKYIGMFSFKDFSKMK